MASDLVLQATDFNFENEVLNSAVPVLVDFWAEWCGPCRAIAPIVSELAAEYNGRLKVYKMNVDENPNTPARYGVRGIPTLIMIKGGKLEDQVVGALPKQQLQKMIDKHM